MRIPVFSIACLVTFCYSIESRAQTYWPDHDTVLHPAGPLRLTWSKPAQATDSCWYVVHLDPGGTKQQVIDRIADTTCLFENWSEGSWTWTVDCYSGDQNTATLIFVGCCPRFRITSSLSVAASEETGSLALTANPCSEIAMLRLTLATAARCSFAVYDALGREVWKEEAMQLPAGQSLVPIELSHLAVNTYLLRAKLGERDVRVMKVVKE